MQFRPGVVTGEEITKWNQREEYPNGYFQTSAIDCAGKNDVVLKFQHLFRWNNWFTGKRAGLWVGVSNDGVNWKEYNVCLLYTSRGDLGERACRGEVFYRTELVSG